MAERGEIAVADDVFLQKTLTTTRDYVLDEDGIRITVKTWLSKDEFKIHYAAIDEERFETTTYSHQWLRLAILFGVLFAIFGLDSLSAYTTVLLGTVTLTFVVLFLLSWEKYVGYYGGDGGLRFFANKPSREELEAFMARVQEKCREYPRGALTDSEVGRSPAEEISRLHALKKAGAITEAEFETLKQNAIQQLESPDKPVTGFAAKPEDRN